MSRQKTFLVALHAYSLKQCLDEAKKIFTGGADGVLLVNNESPLRGNSGDPNLFQIAGVIKRTYPGKVVGINSLDMRNYDALYEFNKYKLDILWTDNSGISEVNDTVILNDKVAKELKGLGPLKRYFGGIDFKGQAPVKDLPAVAKFAAEKFDVVVTSGKHTGQSPSVAKIRTIRDAVGPDVLIAIASGMTTENISMYLPYIDFVIVGTSLQENLDNIFVYDEQKVRDFRAEVDRFQNQSGHIC